MELSYANARRQRPVSTVNNRYKQRVRPAAQRAMKDTGGLSSDLFVDAVQKQWNVCGVE